jgi:hypothetical protein
MTGEHGKGTNYLADPGFIERSRRTNKRALLRECGRLAAHYGLPPDKGREAYKVIMASLGLPADLPR